MTTPAESPHTTPPASRPGTGLQPGRARRARIRWSQVRAQWPLAVVLLGVAVALVFVSVERWRRGTFIMGVVAIGAAALRAVLPESRAGLLAVRSKPFDVVFLTIGSLVTMWLSYSIDSLGTG